MRIAKSKDIPIKDLLSKVEAAINKPYIDLGQFDPNLIILDKAGTYRPYVAESNILLSPIPVSNGITQSIKVTFSGQTLSVAKGVRIGKGSLTNGEALTGTYEVYIVYDGYTIEVIINPITVVGADTTAPILSNFSVEDAQPNRIYFNSSEVITGTTYGGFTINGINPTVTSATVEDADSDALVVVFSKVVTITDITGLSLNGDWTGTTIIGVSGSGTNTLTFALDTPVANGESGSFVYDGTNNIIDGSSNALAAGSTVVTNNVAATFAPTDIAELEVWIPATTETVTEAGTGVSVASDQSGNSRNWAQSTDGQRPSLITDGGKEYLDFVAANSDYLDPGATLETLFQASFSLVFSLKPDDGQPAATQYFFGHESQFANPKGTIGCALTSTGNIAVAYSGGNALPVKVAITNAAVFADGAPAGEVIVIVTVSDADDQISINVNGSNVALDAVSDGDLTGVTFSTYNGVYNPMLGARDKEGTVQQFYDGKLRQVMIFSKVLTATDITNLNTYIGAN